MGIKNDSVQATGCGCAAVEHDKTVKVCVVVEKVFDSCLQKECDPAVVVTLPATGGPFTFVSATFLNGEIENIIVTPIPMTLTARFEFDVVIHYTINLKNALGQPVSISATLTFHKDIVLYFPPTASEFDFNLRVETRSQVLGTPVITATTITLAIGSFVISKLTGCVQLQIPEFGFCPIPDLCEEFIPFNPCDDFEESTPPDFFPPQMRTK